MSSTTKRLSGTLASWNDERGFGFISPEEGTERIFVHIKAFPPGPGRPQIGTELTFDLEHTAEGKDRAARVRPVGHGQRVRRPQGSSSAPGTNPRRGRSRRTSPFADYIMVVIFVAGYLAVNALWPLPLWVAGLYLAASIVSFIVYAIDKSAATNGRWRISENTLLLLGVIGGWPGAIVAQQTLRHKTKKASFRAAFWVTVVLNLIAFAVFATPLAALVVERSTHPLL
ncbi:DUF1294 domain-containing protein [Leifsonia sp. A12D58]|uniref:DUF1294 domain-containing protein n=1 Tax=Leifsonia sp. A12D58 TaxID=3397674 RepID=UPI0039E12D51